MSAGKSNICHWELTVAAALGTLPEARMAARTWGFTARHMTEHTLVVVQGDMTLNKSRLRTNGACKKTEYVQPMDTCVHIQADDRMAVGIHLLGQNVEGLWDVLPFEPRMGGGRRQPGVPAQSVRSPPCYQ